MHPPLGSLVIILQICLLKKSLMIPQVSLPPEGSITIPLIHPNLGGLLTPQIRGILGGATVTPLIWPLILLIHCPTTKRNKTPARASSKTSSHWRGSGSTHPSLLKNIKSEYDSDLFPLWKKQGKSHFGDKKQLDSKRWLVESSWFRSFTSTA